VFSKKQVTTLTSNILTTK